MELDAQEEPHEEPEVVLRVSAELFPGIFGVLWHEELSPL